LPTSTPGTVETGTLTLTPTSGSPIVVNLKGTPDQSFVVLEPDGLTQVTSSSGPVSLSGCGFTFDFTINNNGTGTIDLTGNPYVAISSNPEMTVSAQPVSASIAATTNETFTFSDPTYTNSGDLATVTIAATNSATGVTFTFTFQVADHKNTGC
jgi:hypothetical protein